MAGDSALTIQSATLNGSLTFSTNDTDYMKTVLSSTAALTVTVSAEDASKLVLLVDRPADATNPTILVEDGGADAFTAGSQGNLSLLTTAAGEYIFGPFETSRFQDTGGKINITKDRTDTTIVYVRALLLP
jgi:uncharacterized protein YaiE (UPF0345 family)